MRWHTLPARQLPQLRLRLAQPACGRALSQLGQVAVRLRHLEVEGAGGWMADLAWLQHVVAAGMGTAGATANCQAAPAPAPAHAGGASTPPHQPTTSAAATAGGHQAATDMLPAPTPAAAPAPSPGSLLTCLAVRGCSLLRGPGVLAPLGCLAASLQVLDLGGAAALGDEAVGPLAAMTHLRVGAIGCGKQTANGVHDC